LQIYKRNVHSYLDISQLLCRVSGINARFEDVPGYYGPRTDDDIVADRHGKYCGIGAYRDMIAYAGALPLGWIAARGAAAGEEIIDEHDAMPDKTMITYFHQLTDKTMGLDLAKIADPRISLDLYKGTDKGIIADRAAIEIHRRYDRYLLAESNVRGDSCLFYIRVHAFLALE
jgi:hypothetical protein